MRPPALIASHCARGGAARANLLEWPERGGATLVGLALAGFVLMAGVVAVDVGALAGARAAAQTAADMAALAALTPAVETASLRADWGQGSGAFRFQAADQVQDGPASWAAEIAMANGAELVRCDCSAVQAVVSVRRRVRFVPGGLTVSVTARARAVLGRPPP